MSRIFVSHSSKDNFFAVAIVAWLKDEGWDDCFLDLDATQGIRPGERWERALYDQAADCEAVLFLISRNWLASEWCRREYELARKLNKRVFAILIENIPRGDLPDYLKETHQTVSLALGEDHRVFHPRMPVTQQEGHVTFSAEGLSRLKNGLTQSGLDPRFFAWPPEKEPDRAPYRGLEPMDGFDAGVFFGRDGPIIEALDFLRGLREAACPRLFVILGASGAGKSSFLRAGLLPRLARDDRHFLSLPAIRPERATMNGSNGFVAALAELAVRQGSKITRAQIRDAARKGADELRPILQQLVARPGTEKPPILVVTVDQAEELFRTEGLAEGESFLTLLRDLTMRDEPAMVALLAIRSDSFDALERAKPLEGLSQKAFPLLPMPRGAFQTVIEGPAKRLAQAGKKFEIDPGLTQALLEDIEQGGGSDALPLLAFTLEQLYRDHSAAKRITHENYVAFGGLKGAIEAALARVFDEADKDARIPKDREARLALLRRGLIPWLAGVDPDTMTPRRRIARATQIPDEARPLVDLLVEQRLLTRDIDKDTGEATVEPAHEALLRQWGGLKGWLAEDFGRLMTLEGVTRAARDWDANARADAWVAHRGERLAEAQALDSRPEIAARLDTTDKSYLSACRAHEDAARAEIERQRKEREAAQVQRIADAEALAAAEQRTAASRVAEARAVRRVAQRTAIGFVAALVLAAAAFMFAIHARRAQTVAEASRLLTVSQSDLQDRKVDQAIQASALALDMMPSEVARSGLFDALAKISPHLLGTLKARSSEPEALTWIDQESAAVATSDGKLQYFSVADPSHRPQWSSRAPTEIRREDSGPVMLKRLESGDLIVVYADTTVGVLREHAGSVETIEPNTQGKIAHLPDSASIGRDGTFIISSTVDDRVMSFRCNVRADAEEKACLEKDFSTKVFKAGVRSVSISPDDKRIAFGDRAGFVYLCEADDAAPCRSTSSPLAGGILSIAWSRDGLRVAAGTEVGEVVVLDFASLKELARSSAGKAVTALAWRPEGSELASVCQEETICLWALPTDPEDGALHIVTRFVGHHAEVIKIAWSPQGSLLASVSTEGEIRIWTIDQDRSVFFSLPPCQMTGLETLAISPDHSWISAGGTGGAICLWQAEGQQLATFLGQSRATVRAMAWNKNGDIAALHEDGTLETLAVATRQLVTFPNLPTEFLSRVAWSEGGGLLIVSVSGGQLAFIDPARPAERPRLMKYAFNPDGASGMAVRPSDDQLFVSFTHSVIGLVDLRSGAFLGSMPSAPSSSGNLSISPDGRLLAATGSEWGIGIYNLLSKGIPQKLPVDAKETRAVSFSPDGLKLAALGSPPNNVLYVWDMSSSVPTLREKLNVMNNALFGTDLTSPRASWIAWLSSDEVATATTEGTVVIVSLDEKKWRDRIRNLGLVAVP